MDYLIGGKKSLHGTLIESVLQHWGEVNLFEQNDSLIREGLQKILSEKLNIETSIEFTDTPETIDKQWIVGKVSFKDEHGLNKVADFVIMSTGIAANEFEFSNNKD